jgi:hypothetical protein
MGMNAPLFPFSLSVQFHSEESFYQKGLMKKEKKKVTKITPQQKKFSSPFCEFFFIQILFIGHLQR